MGSEQGNKTEGLRSPTVERARSIGVGLKEVKLECPRVAHRLGAFMHLCGKQARVVLWF